MDISALRERSAPAPLTVTELNNHIKRIFEKDITLKAVSVRGEISNFVNHRTGHFYFSLKDADGQVRAVMFRPSTLRLKFMPENGMKVVIHGSVNLYVKDGSYQIYVNSIEPDGIGALYLAYEQLKAKLENEGLFDVSAKKPIPEMPLKIGVITSPTGAAVRDIINVTGRRFPMAKIYLYPSLVQGSGAEENLIKALDYFDKSQLVDVILIGRGGGSIEDLWAFNGERLARKIFECSIPVISAVGHETDFTICDFVSDMRAPTPSAAAEMAVPDAREILMRISAASDRSVRALIRSAERKREKLDYIKKSPVFKDSTYLFDAKKTTVNVLSENILRLTSELIKDARNSLAVLGGRIDALSPLSVLSRGYSLAECNNNIVKTVNAVSVGDDITILVSDGKIIATVKEKDKEL